MFINEQAEKSLSGQRPQGNKRGRPFLSVFQKEVIPIPRKVIQSFEVEQVSVLSPDGTVDNEQMPDLTEDQIKEMYHLMKLTRTIDVKLFKLQRSGKIGTYAEVKGEEASEIGSAFALEDDDWVVPSFRELGVMIARNADHVKLVQAWRGDNRAFHDPAHHHNLPTAIPIASQLLHAAGIAWASKLRKEKAVTIVYFGDGATSEGDFHEALNFASDLNLPVIFLCQNNQWAISTPRAKQTHAQTIAQKSIAYGMPGVQVDGNDVLAVYKVTKEAVDRARNGEGPTLIETMTYRMGDHTTSDDSLKYRTQEEVDEWSHKDPLVRLENYFKKIGTWTDEYGKYVEDTVTKEVEEAVEKGLAIPPPPPEEMFTHIYSLLPADLEAQKKAMLEEIKEGSQ